MIRIESYLYKNYLDICNSKNYASESLESLLKCEGIYVDNPLGEEPTYECEKVTDFLKYLAENPEFYKKTEQWKAAEANCWEKILILEKI